VRAAASPGRGMVIDGAKNQVPGGKNLPSAGLPCAGLGTVRVHTLSAATHGFLPPRLGWVFQTQERKKEKKEERKKVYMWGRVVPYLPRRTAAKGLEPRRSCRELLKRSRPNFGILRLFNFFSNFLTSGSCQSTIL